MADESVKKAAATLKTAADMIYQLDDTMTEKEENMIQRANNLRRTSEVTFKTIDKLKHRNARRIRSNGDVQTVRKFERTWSIDIDDDLDDQSSRTMSQRTKPLGKRNDNWNQKRRKSS